MCFSFMFSAPLNHVEPSALWALQIYLLNKTDTHLVLDHIFS